MTIIKLSSSEEILFKDFKEGNSVQFRVTVSPGEESEYAKGKTVRVIYGNDESTGRIVSDPLVVTPSRDNGKETLALVVEKSE